MRIILIVAVIATMLILSGCGGGSSATKLATTKVPAVGALDARGGYVPPVGYTESAIYAVYAYGNGNVNPIQGIDSEGTVTWTIPATSTNLYIFPTASNTPNYSDGRSIKRGGGPTASFQYWFSGSNTSAVSTTGAISFDLIGEYKISATFFSPDTENGLWAKAKVIVISQADWYGMSKFDAAIMGYTPYSYSGSVSVPAKFTALDAESDGTVKAKVGQQLAAKGLIVPLNRGGEDMTTSTIEDVQVTVLNDLGLPTNGQWELGDTYASPYALFTVNSIGYYKVEIRVVSDSGKKITTITKRLHIEQATTPEEPTLTINMVKADGTLKPVSLDNGILPVLNNVRFNITATKAGWETTGTNPVAFQEIVIFNMDTQISPPLMVGNTFIQGLPSGTGTGTVRVMLRKTGKPNEFIYKDFTVNVIDGLGTVR
jgi:hypothetical protein